MDVKTELSGVTSPYTRHLGIFDPHKHPVSATIIGCGAVGSFVAVGLAKMGIKRQRLYDHDTVEIENLPVQMHGKGSIGQHKVAATYATILSACPEEDVQQMVDPIATKWEDQPIRTDIVVSAVDSLEVRKAIWQSVKYDPAVRILADARIGGQAMKIYAVSPVSPDDIRVYDDSFKSMNGSELPCTERGVIDVSLFSSALIIRAIRRWITTGRKETYRVFDLSGEIPNMI